MVDSLRLFRSLLLTLSSLVWYSDFLSATPAVPSESSAELNSGDGYVRLDVVVTDKSGDHVAGLKQDDFTLLDNGQQLKLVSFRAFDEDTNKPDASVEIIFAIDALNLSSQQVTVAEREVGDFLREDQGRLTRPVMIYRLSESSLSASLQPSMDGMELAKETESAAEPRVVWKKPFRKVDPILTMNFASERNTLSLSGLGAIAIDAKSRPGRKLLFWIGPGWPVEAGGDSSFDEIVEFSTRLREARIHLFSVTAWAYPEREFTYERYLRGVRTAKDAMPGDMALEVLASRSGGRVMAPASKLKETIDACVEHAGDYYTLTFDPPLATRPDEYHELKVTVDKPDISVRTNSEYYDQPTFHDEPPPPRELVTVEKLQQIVDSLRSLPDEEAARRLSVLELADRLSLTRTEKMKSLAHGRKAKEALILLADRSAFLPLPAAEIPTIAAPSVNDQRLMLDGTIQYLHDTVPTLPNLFATRTTIQYEEPEQKQNQTWKTAAVDQSLHPAPPESVIVLVRNSREITETATQAPKRTNRRTHGLTTEGTFGTMAAITLVVDIAGPHSQMTWSRWEQYPEGQRAVFRYSVPRESSHFEARFCCLAEPDGTVPFRMMSAYHGEIAIDPETGAVFRITVQADFPPRLPMVRSDIMVEYGSVVIGDKTYICPIRSVSVSRSRTVRLLHQWFMHFGVYGPFETALNDVTFSNYHLFQSGHRILTDVSPAP